MVAASALAERKFTEETMQIDGEQRTTHRKRHRVPRVGVLRSTVYEHELGFIASPPQRTDHAGAALAIVDRRLDPDHVRQVVDIEVELGDVLVEQTELVVGTGSDVAHPGHVVTNTRPRANATCYGEAGAAAAAAAAVVVVVVVVVGDTVVVVAGGIAVVVGVGVVVVVEGGTVVVVVVLVVVVE